MEHIIKRHGNIFYAGDNFKSRYGEIIFEEDDKHRIIIKHTFVDQKYRGQGIALLLLDKVMELAMDGKYTIVPECPFAIKVMKRSNKYKRLLDPSFKG